MRGAALLLAIGPLAGCGPFARLSPPAAAVVAGTVRIGGQAPGQPGWVCFFPEPRTVGDPAFARIAVDGTFRAEGVPIGRVQPRFRFRDPGRLPPQSWAAVQAAASSASPLRLATAGENVRYDLDLLAP